MAGRHGRQEERAVARGLREVGAIAHHEQRTHLCVHVTVDPDDACPLEPDGARLAPAVEAEIEGLLLGEGENVVIERIVVREGHRGADRHHQHVRREGLLRGGYLGLHRGASATGAALEPDDCRPDVVA